MTFSKVRKLKRDRVVARDYRNSRIGDFLKELHLTEGRGTGIPKIRNFLKKNGSPNPIFETDPDRTYFLTTLKPHPDSELEPSSDQVTPQATPQVTPQVHNLLKHVAGEITRVELMDAIGLKDRKNFGVNYLQPALKEGLIEMTKPDSPTNPNQKYRLTKRGKISLEKLKNDANPA